MFSLIFFVICGVLVLAVVLAMAYHRKKVKDADRPKEPTAVESLEDEPGKEL